MRRTVLVFGLIAGTIMSIVMAGITMPFHDRLGNDAAMVVGYTSMVVAFLMVWFGVRSYRDDVAGGAVTFGRALAVGLLITFVASTVYVLTWQVIYNFFAPDFVANYGARVLEEARAGGATAAELAAKAQELREFEAMYRNPLFNVAVTYLEPAPVGILFSFASAWVHSRTRGAPRSVGATAAA